MFKFNKDYTIYGLGFVVIIVLCVFVISIGLSGDRNYDQSISKIINEQEQLISNGHRRLSTLYDKNVRPIAVLGAPFSKGQYHKGTELAPDLFRKQNIVTHIRNLGYHRVVDYGNLNFTENELDQTNKTRNNFTVIHNQYTLSEANLLIGQKVEQILKNNETLVVLGGDHSVTAGSILANARVNPEDVCVLYVDAHADISDCETTTYGKLHGMPLSFVIKEMESRHNNYKSCPAMKVLKPLIQASDVAYMALRDLVDSEINIFNELNITHYSIKDVDELGIKVAVHQILNTVCKSKSKIHVSFDIDSLDVMYAPNTGTTVFGGLTVREALQMAEMIASSKKLNVIELYEVNPLIKPEELSEQTVNIGMNIILAFLGKSRETHWALPFNDSWILRNDH